MRERSEFVHEGGRWLYVRGTIAPADRAPRETRTPQHARVITPSTPPSSLNGTRCVRCDDIFAATDVIAYH